MSDEMTISQPTEGGLGGGVASPYNGARDTRLIEKLAKNPEWEIPPLAFQTVPAAMVRVVHGRDEKGQPAKYSTRNRIAAARVVGLFHGQNQRARQGGDGQTGVTINVGDGGTVGLIQTRQQLLSEDRYLEYLRTAQGDSDAGLVCDAREPGPVEAGEASQAARQGGNGHADGNGRH